MNLYNAAVDDELFRYKRQRTKRRRHQPHLIYAQLNFFVKASSIKVLKGWKKKAAWRSKKVSTKHFRWYHAYVYGCCMHAFWRRNIPTCTALEKQKHNIDIIIDRHAWPPNDLRVRDINRVRKSGRSFATTFLFAFARWVDDTDTDTARSIQMAATVDHALFSGGAQIKAKVVSYGIYYIYIRVKRHRRWEEEAGGWRGRRHQKVVTTTMLFNPDGRLVLCCLRDSKMPNSTQVPGPPGSGSGKLRVVEAASRVRQGNLPAFSGCGVRGERKALSRQVSTLNRIILES